MPGHNQSFARQFPIEFAYFEYSEITGFNRCRFDLLASLQFAVAILIAMQYEVGPSLGRPLFFAGPVPLPGGNRRSRIKTATLGRYP